MGNPVSGKLPEGIDTMLQDLSQTEDLFTYTDIMNFGDLATEEDLKKLRKLRDKLLCNYEMYNAPTGLVLAKIRNIVIGRINKSKDKLPEWKKDLWR